jgi:hypothetical protein
MSIGRGKLMVCGIAGLTVLLGGDVARSQQAAATNAQPEAAEGTLARQAREATSAFRNTPAAVAAGYELASGCVSGPELGAMGVHYVNGTLVGDGTLDVAQPEALVYEPNGGQLQLAAVEYIVLAAQWDAANDHPPVLQGQHFHYVPAPNRAGLDAHYELHVWAWKRNPNGTFADWNPRVSCDGYSPQ